MVIICDMESIYQGIKEKDNSGTKKGSAEGKVSTGAKNQIEKMKETDQLVIVSVGKEICVNAETLNLLLHTKGKVEIKEYQEETELCVEIGIALGKTSEREEIRVVLNNENIKNTFSKKYKRVSFGWGSSNGRNGKTVKNAGKNVNQNSAAAIGETAPPKTTAPKTAELKAKVPKAKATKPAEPKTAEQKAKVPKAKAPKAAAPERISELNPRKEEQEILEDDLKTIKTAMGKGYTKADLQMMKEILNLTKKSSSEEFDFMCRIKLPILYNKDGFMEKFVKLRG